MRGTEERKEARAGSAELRERLERLVDALVAPGRDPATCSEEVVDAARALVQRKLSLAGSKHDTGIHLEALLRERLGDCFPGGGSNGQGATERAELAMSAILASGLLAEFSAAVDRIVLESGTPSDYSFAGRADFIGLEEILQLLGGGKHTGCLTLERPDNRVDVYLDRGSVAFIDPHRFIRRVLPARGGMGIREIKSEMLQAAEREHGQAGTPIFFTLREQGFFKEEELREVVRQLGTEVLFEFLRDQVHCRYSYRRLHELPSYAAHYNLRLPVTPILLEGNKRLDDWRSMTRVFPDPDQQLQPVPDMIARISSLDLSVLEIKMLAQVSGKMTPRKLSPAMGLPLPDVYHHLIRFAKEGVLVPPGGDRTLEEVAMSIEESVQMAFQALDANDDHIAVSSALDKVLGFGEEPSAGDRPSKPRLFRTLEDDEDEDGG